MLASAGSLATYLAGSGSPFEGVWTFYFSSGSVQPSLCILIIDIPCPIAPFKRDPSNAFLPRRLPASPLTPHQRVAMHHFPTRPPFHPSSSP